MSVTLAETEEMDLTVRGMITESAWGEKPPYVLRLSSSWRAQREKLLKIKELAQHGLVSAHFRSALQDIEAEVADVE